ncbi:hypothetical protein DFH11DRAFT_71702 [Phellopilus nigrolimitatus]|nr:hypothetical protein DFH11DRAFT_71702 [Phellopilus nigrolimitatus]
MWLLIPFYKRKEKKMGGSLQRVLFFGSWSPSTLREDSARGDCIAISASRSFTRAPVLPEHPGAHTSRRSAYPHSRSRVRPFCPSAPALGSLMLTHSRRPSPVKRTRANEHAAEPGHARRSEPRPDLPNRRGPAPAPAIRRVGRGRRWCGPSAKKKKTNCSTRHDNAHAHARPSRRFRASRTFQGAGAGSRRAQIKKGGKVVNSNSALRTCTEARSPVHARSAPLAGAISRANLAPKELQGAPRWRVPACMPIPARTIGEKGPKVQILHLRPALLHGRARAQAGADRSKNRCRCPFPPRVPPARCLSFILSFIHSFVLFCGIPPGMPRGNFEEGRCIINGGLYIACAERPRPGSAHGGPTHWLACVICDNI